MNKRVLLILGLAVMSTSAFATKARLLALGETETSGSLYFSDNRNMFFNAAYVNEYKDFMTIEFGGEGADGSNEDTDTKPFAEGGVFKSFGHLVWGVYIGGETASTHEARQYLRIADAVNPKIHQDNQIDAFIGGEAGFKWGANLTYSKTNDDANKMKQSSLSTRWGVIANDFEAFANVALLNKAEANGVGAVGTDEFKGKLGYELGGNYNLGSDYKAFAYWRHAGFDTETVTAAAALPGGVGFGPAYTGTAEFNTNKYRLGVGRDSALNSKARLLTKLEYVMNSRKVETKDGDADLKDYAIPLTVGIEYDANSWLTLRGSAYQSLIGQQDNDYDTSLLTGSKINPAVLSKLKPNKRSFNSTTNINAGAGLKFGNLAFDGLIGTGTAAGEITDSNSEQGLITLDNLMTRLAMTYRF